MEFVEWIACFTGLAGALLLALNNQFSRWGFVCFLASNIFWIAFSVANGTHGLLVSQLGFTVTSLIGIFRWFPITRKFVRT